MPETGEATEDLRRDRRRQHEVWPQQRQNPDSPGGKIDDAEFANQRQGVVARDVENLLGGEPGVEIFSAMRTPAPQNTNHLPTSDISGAAAWNNECSITIEPTGAASRRQKTMAK